MFWLIATLLIIFGLAFILLPLLGSFRTGSSNSRTKLNRSIYQAKVSELKADMDSGLLDENEYQHALQDLQHTLLDDAKAEESKPLVSRKSIGAVITVTLVLPLSAVLMYVQISTLPSPQQLAQQQSTLSQAQSIQASITGLEEKLKQNPNDFDGWVMLGQSYFVMRNFDDAKQAYIKASTLVSNADPNVLVQIAEASAYSNSEQFGVYEKDLLDKALQIDPDNERALWYAGYADYTSLDYEGAVAHWEELVRQVPDDRPDVKASLTQFLTDARQKAGLPEVAETDNSEPAKTARMIQVSVAINPGLADNAQPGDTLFVYARAVNGPKMPLSLARMSVADLPAEVTLSKDMAMIANMDLNTFEQVEVLARVSKTGQAITQPGDLISMPVQVDFSAASAASIAVEISDIVD